MSGLPCGGHVDSDFAGDHTPFYTLKQLRESAVEGTSLLKTSSSAQCLLGRRTRFEKASSSDVPQKRLSEKQQQQKQKNRRNSLEFKDFV